MALSNPPNPANLARPIITRAVNSFRAGPPPISSPLYREDRENSTDAVLELGDGTTYRGIEFGAEGKSVAGECVFQTGRPVSDLEKGILTKCSKEWWDIPNH